MNVTRLGTRKKRRPALLAGALLMLIGVVVFAFRASNNVDVSAPGDTMWRITLELGVSAGDAMTRVGIAPPFDTLHARLVSQSLDLYGLRLRRVRANRTNRDLILVSDSRGRHRARIVYDVRLSALPWRGANTEGRSLSAQMRERFLQPGPGIPSDSSSFTELAESLDESRVASGAVSEQVVQHIMARITTVHRLSGGDALSALRSGQATTLAKAQATVALLRASRIPARLVSGVVLSERRAVQPHVWLEAFEDGGWKAYDPEFGYMTEVPPDYLPLRRGDEPLAFTDVAAELSLAVAVQRRVIAFPVASATDQQWLSYLNFASLPAAARETVGLLLLLPLGALVTVVARQVVGVRTYGIFSPALLALAAQFVEASTAVVMVAVVAVLGTGGRALLPGLRLSRTPRLAIVFTLVVVSMAIGVSLLLHSGRSVESVLVLLPVVVLANLVDRVYAVADERGLACALTRLLWTLVASAICFLVFRREDLGQWFVHHPELHLLTLAFMVMIGGYKKQKLAEYPALRWLQEPESTKINLTQATESEKAVVKGN